VFVTLALQFSKVLIFLGAYNASVHRAAESERAKWRSFPPYVRVYNLGKTEHTYIIYVVGGYAS